MVLYTHATAYGACRIVTHPAYPDTTELRLETDRLIADHSATSAAQAHSVLSQLWRADRSPAVAAFIISRFEQLRSHLPTVSCKVAVLRSFTIEPVVPLARASAALAGIDLQVQVSDFNAYAQEAIDPTSRLYAFAPDVVIFAVQTRDLAPSLWQHYLDPPATKTDAETQHIVDSYPTWINAIRKQSEAHVIIHNLEQPATPNAGVLDAQGPGQCEAIRQINQQLTALAAKHAGVYILDYDALVAQHGREAWFDNHKWLTMRMPIAAGCLIHLADEWLRFIHPITGKICKCLVCDLDNTLWGGIIGEDGMDEIQLGLEYPGAAYVDMQRTILDLCQRGIVLAICSKNNHDDAMEVIRNHPYMLIQSSHLAAIKINWIDKVQNLRQISEELNIGIDSLAFVDDNPAECELVRRRLPEVTVIELPEDPMQYAATLRRCPNLERLTVSEEDHKRGQMYVQQRDRSQLQQAASSLEDYYRSLQMVAEIALINPSTLPRVAQLTQKTNQFNLTTKRYSEQQIADYASTPYWRGYWCRVTDRFGDNGIVGVVITHQINAQWEIDTFLLSCRVIGRTVETAMLATIAQHARDGGATRLVGSFHPTKKNAPASDFYKSHGFACISESDDETTWTLDLVQSRLDPPPWIELRISKKEVPYDNIRT